MVVVVGYDDDYYLQRERQRSKRRIAIITETTTATATRRLTITLTARRIHSVYSPAKMEIMQEKSKVKRFMHQAIINDPDDDLQSSFLIINITNITAHYNYIFMGFCTASWEII